MNLKFENLEKIDDILEKINTLEQKLLGEKRWLNTKEAATYLGYSKDHIHKLKETYFTQGQHYFKKAGRVLFDKYELDNWVTSSFNEIDIDAIVKDVVKDLI